jgi:hypothetical protein
MMPVGEASPPPKPEEVPMDLTTALTIAGALLAAAQLALLIVERI